MVTGSNELIRDINSSLVLNLIIKEVSISRASISKKTGLTKATVSAITETLKQQDLIEEAGNTSSGAGRKAVLFRFKQEHGYAMSIDLRPDNITILCANLLCQKRELFTFPNTSDREHIIPDLIEMLRHVANNYSGPQKLRGICLGIHGTTFNNQVTFCPYSPYEGLPFSETLSEIFQVPVYLENEANLSAIGEHSFYFHKSSMIFISVHFGIGIGIMIDGNLFTGFCGKSGEFGHSIIELDGRPCPCGNNGCLEQYASDQAILKDYCTRKHLAHCSHEEFLQACRENDADALYVLKKFEKYMIVCVNNILNTFNPEVIVLNSFITTELLESLQNIKKGLHNRMTEHCTLLPSLLQDQACLVGGICLCTKNYLKLPSLNFTQYIERP